MAQLMRKNVLTGALAAREYIHFFRDPIGCMCTLHRQRGKLVALGPIAFGEPTKLHVLAIGPEFNRQVLGDPAKFRTTSLVLSDQYSRHAISSVAQTCRTRGTRDSCIGGETPARFY